MDMVHRLMILMLIANCLSRTEELLALTLPASDLIIDANKGFALHRLGFYASELKEDFVHSVVPFGDLCTSSPMIEQCKVTSLPISTTIIEVITIAQSHDVVSALPRFDGKRISRLIGNDIGRLLRVHRTKKFVAAIDAVVHLANDQLYSVNNTDGAIEMRPTSLSEDEEMDIPRLIESVQKTILRKVNEKRLGFDYLPDADLMSLFTAISASIDESLQVRDVQEAYQYFSQLIIGQTVYLLRSCSAIDPHNSNSQPCFIVSTLFVRPTTERDGMPEVYRLIPLPVIVHGQRYEYSIMSEMIGIDIDDQELMVWENVPTRSECLFSIFVHCKHKPPVRQLSTSPCLSQLIDSNAMSSNHCQVLRTRDMGETVMNVEDDVWLFTHDQETMHCHINSINGELRRTISIDTPSIQRLPCQSTIKCNNVEFSSSACRNRSVSIKSSSGHEYLKLAEDPWRTEKMASHLQSIYALTGMQLAAELSDQVLINRSPISHMVKEFYSLFLSILFLLLLSLTLAFLRWIKVTVQKRVTALERDFDDLVNTPV